MKRLKTILLSLLMSLLLIGLPVQSFNLKSSKAESYPYYKNDKENLTLRSKFYTSYPSSLEERKDNIKLATKSINNYFLDVNEEFSFNKVVGVRSEARGYKIAKIIINGRFVDGVGGGVCQVSTTLYNAVLLAGLKITEYHPHTLPVSYIAPSFDAMVNSGGADLKFVNNTNNPIFIIAVADSATVKIEIYGEEMKEKLVRQSVVTKTISVPEPETIKAGVKEYPDLSVGDSKYLTYGKEGLMSEGFLISIKDGGITKINKIRTDVYKAMRGLIVEIVE